MGDTKYSIRNCTFSYYMKQGNQQLIVLNNNPLFSRNNFVICFYTYNLKKTCSFVLQFGS